jgi:hypothetical protein
MISRQLSSFFHEFDTLNPGSVSSARQPIFNMRASDGVGWRAHRVSAVVVLLDKRTDLYEVHVSMNEAYTMSLCPVLCHKVSDIVKSEGFRLCGVLTTPLKSLGLGFRG